MPIVTFIFGFLSMPFACIFDKLIISVIAIVAGIVIDIIIYIIIKIKDKDKPEPGFTIDWGA